MAPTICSEKKRQTRTIANTDIRRHGQRSQLNQALSHIVNYVAKGSINPRVSASLRIRTHNQAETNTTNTTHHNNRNDASSNNNHSTQTSATLAANHRRQQFSFLSDNAVTSSTQSDTENSFDLRLANEALTNDSTIYSNSSSNINPSSSSSVTLALSSQQRETSSSTSLCEERRFKSCSSKVQANDFNNEDDVTDTIYEDDNDKAASHAEANKMHSKHFFQYGNEEEEEEEVNDDVSGASMYASGSDTDMDTDSMTSLDTEKSAELKRGNHPLWRDKFFAKQQLSNNNTTKSLTNVHNAEGLLSIAIKTIKLVKRNQLLQQRLTQLQLETSEFIQSVLANPENRHFRDNIKQKVKQVENV